jgi:hypothetical protein
MEIPGAPIHVLDCCDAQELHIGHQGSICFDKPPAIRDTDDATSVIGKCRFCEQTIVVERHKGTGEWIVRSAQPS